MDFTNLLEELKITKYTEGLDKFCGSTPPVSICDEENVRRLDEKYDILGKYRAPLYECLNMTRENAALREYGDLSVSYMLSRGVDLSPESIDESLRLATRLTRERYPEFDAKAIHFVSWMLDPRLAEMLGEDSRLTKFLSRFSKHPCKSDGNAVFTCVFPGKPESLDDLPEDTSLQRKIKAHYLGGGYIHSFAGVITEEF